MLSHELYSLVKTISTQNLEEFMYHYHQYNVLFSSRQKGSIVKDNGYLLRQAAEYGNLPIVQFLVKQGVDVHTDKDYPLRYSAKHGHLEVVKFLVEQGADVHAKNNRALQQACSYGHFAIAQFLINNGADPSCEKFHSIYSCVKNQHYDILEIFSRLHYDIEKIVRSYKDEEVIKHFSSWILNNKLNSHLQHKKNTQRLKI